MTVGPVVGHARVNTNLSMDDSSIGDIGDRIAAQLSTMGDRMNDKLVSIGKRNGKVYRDIGRDAVVAWRATLGVFVSSAPWMGAAVSAVAGSVTMLAGSLYSLAQSSFALYPVLGSLGVAFGTLKIGMKGFVDAIRADTPEALAAALEKLTPSAQDAALSFRGLADDADTLRASVQESMFANLSPEIDKLANTLFPALTTGMTKMADEWNNLAIQVLNYVNSAQGLSTISTALDGSASIFGKLKDAVVPFLDGALKLFNALTPAGERLADRITDIASRFQSWTSAEGFGDRIDAMMQRAETTGGLLLTVIQNLGGALANVFGAANDETNTFLTWLVDITQRFEDWTGSVEGDASISQWAGDAIRVMVQLGDTLGAIFDVVKNLASADALISFLQTLEDAFDWLNKLPLQAAIDKFVELAEIFRPIAGPILAFIIAGAAFNIALGNIIGQISGAVAVLNIGKDAFSKFMGLLGGGSSQLSGFSGFVGKFKDFAGILSKGLKIAGIAGVIAWIGTLILKSEDLQSKFKDIWNAVKNVFSSLGGAFSQISGSLGPALSKLQPFFDLLDKIGTLVVGVVLDMIAGAIQGIADVISGVGSIVSGFIDMLTGLFSWDPALMLQGWNTFVSGLGPLISGAFNLFITFFAPAKLLKIGATALKAFGSGFSSVAGSVLGRLGTFLGDIISKLGVLPGKFFEWASKSITKFVDAITQGASGAGAAAGKVFNAVVDWLIKLPGKLLSFGRDAMTKITGAISNGVSAIKSAASRVYDTVTNAIKELPGKLQSFGKDAMTKITGAISNGVSAIKSAASRVYDTVTNAIKELPGKLQSFGKDAMTKITGAISNGVSDVRSAAERIASSVMNAIKSLPDQVKDIGSRLVTGIADGISAGVRKVKDAAGRVAQAIKDFLPGSPVKEGPLTAWNKGSGASGGGHNVVQGIVAGLSDVGPIRSAMSDVANAVRESIDPTINVRGRTTMAAAGAGGGGSVIHIANLTMPVTVSDLESIPRIASVLEGLAMKVRQGVRSGM